jgi:ribonuclease VapC
MLVDASALVAILLREPEGDHLLERLDRSDRRATHPISIYEAASAMARRKDCTIAEAYAEVSSFVAGAGLDIVAIRTPEAIAALEAFARYGKGRHPAKLNMGDCFSYAVAKLRSMPLLFKGDDFTQTDLAQI